MTTTTTISNATITALVRENNSRMGNPSYTVFFVNHDDDGSMWAIKTQANAGFVYRIDRSWVGNNVNITYKHYSRYMRITDMEL